MKGSGLLALAFLQAAPRTEPPVAEPQRLQYERRVEVPAGVGQVCAVLDGQIFPHASAALKDLRVFPEGAVAGAHEIPYAMTLSHAVTEETEPARVVNLGQSGRDIVFDLEMPPREYTEVMLDLAGHDFLATATVSGGFELKGLGQGKATVLGTYTLFDLASHHLSRDTTLPLQESDFRYLHVILKVSPAPGSSSLEAGAARFVPTPAMVEGAQVPPSREAQIVYSPVAETATVRTEGRESVASFVVPARVPIERVSFVPAAEFKGNFSRDVRVTAVVLPADKSTSAGGTVSGLGTAEEDIAADERSRPPALPETMSGTILRVHTTQAGRELRSEQMSVPAILGANLQRAAKVEVRIENGDDQPIPIAAVRLEMRQRKLCFEVVNGVAPALYYGDAALVAPVYDYARLFAPIDRPLIAALGPERKNADFRSLAAEARPFTERHPELLWIVLIVVVLMLAGVAFRSSRNMGT